MQILIIAEDNSQLLLVNQQQLLKLQELNIQQQEQLKQLNQEIDQLKKNELQLQNELQQNKQLNDTLNTKLKEQQQQYQQLQDTLNNNIKELKTKDQELQNQLLQHQDLLKELKCVYPYISIKWTIGKNTILKDDYFSKILKTIEEKTKKKVKNQYFIYSGAQNGLNGQSFWKSVDKLSNLLMIFKSKSGYIFGAFSPCTWMSNCNGYIQDDTLSSFIFSQTHDQIYPIKEGYKQHAIYSGQQYGPIFGSGHDIYISTDFQGSSSNLGNSYQCDQFQINNNRTHLFGQSTPNIAECEILMLTFL
ncbi:unnamed protein product [Paramecium pentaurelia]|uniref:TLDc domain-containing protein n=1 Tax=Paramecium pentaurelia TaxID=43138 RepID=A0A8S1YDB7_9CILI|nr:unnamed protein product [Paramecium pentaurelia]